ncbi:MAG: hypothetical protein IAG10_02020 [Planctomycetaceae bacterium]|nr:hypothetical protein [Planctomycetaceae bacterium]
MVVEPEEPEVIRQQMADSRTALTEKLGFLEEKVTETVQNATTSVTDTVNSATASVVETVDSVKSAVQETVATVKHSVEGTVASVTEAFDLPHQVAAHPWPMMAGAIGVGYLIGYSLPSAPSQSRAQQYGLTGSAGYRNEVDYQATGAATNGKASSALGAAAPSGFLSSIGEMFQSELTQLKGLAIGTAVGLVRDMLSESAPSSLKREVADVIDRVTEKLGGHRISGTVLSPGRTGRTESSTESLVGTAT